MKIKLKGGGEFVVKTVTTQLVQREDGKPLVAVVSTPAVDSYGDIIHQGPNEKGKGWVLERFNQNPRIYWMHDPFRPNLAMAKAWVDNDALMHEIRFDVRDSFAAELDRKYREGFLSEWSVGFKPITKSPVGEGAFSGEHYWEQLLVETSSVNRGANPDTATVSKALLLEPEQIDDEDSDVVALLKAEIADYREELNQRLRAIEAALMKGAQRNELEETARVKDITARAGKLLQRISQVQA